MVVRASNGNTIDIDLKTTDYITPENNYRMTRNIVSVAEAKLEVDKWWEHLVSVMEAVL